MYASNKESYYIEAGKKILVTPKANLLTKVEELRDILRYHEWKYYVMNEPIISDFEYDQLFNILKSIEKDNPQIITNDSPTQRVSNDLNRDFPTIEHAIPMLSLENSYSESDLVDWEKRVRSYLSDEEISFSVEPKFDGSSFAIVYENDVLVRAATRGDGERGEEITNNIRVINSIPLNAKFSAFGATRVELRGEVVIDKKLFKLVNERRMEEGLPIMANPRNAASGSLRMLDSSEVAKRGLDAFIYSVGYAIDKDGTSLLQSKFNSHIKSIEYLYNLGFKSTHNVVKKFNNIDQIIEYCQEWESKRDSFPFEIDGMVIKLDEHIQQEKCGATSHHPRWAIAYKFKAKQANTRLIQIDYQVGRTGAITPVAKLEPVQLAGVTISSVSLFNEDVIREKQLKIGDTVLLERAGDVIPYIVKPIESARTGNESDIIFPKQCPSCQSMLVKPEEEAAWRCVNIGCPAQAQEKIIHFVSKNAMNIDGLGEKLVKKLYKLGILNSITGIFNLDFSQIANIEGLGEKSVTKLEKSIEKSKSQDLHRLIFGLGIRYVGQTTAKTLSSAIENLTELESWSEEKLMTLKDIGPKVAESVADFFSNKNNLKMIMELSAAGVNISNHSTEKKGTSLMDKTFLFTGSLQKFNRNEAQEMVEQNGGKLLSSVSANLNYLVVGDSAGSKLTKAKEIPSINIITEEEFLSMIK